MISKTSFALRVSLPSGPNSFNDACQSFGHVLFREASHTESAAHRPCESESLRRLQTKLDRAVTAHRKSRNRASVTRFDRAIPLLHVGDQLFENVAFIFIDVPTIVSLGRNDDDAIR